MSKTAVTSWVAIGVTILTIVFVLQAFSIPPTTIVTEDDSAMWARGFAHGFFAVPNLMFAWIASLFDPNSTYHVWQAGGDIGYIACWVLSMGFVCFALGTLFQRGNG